MKKEFVVNLQGKDYPTYRGVLDEAHERGLVSIQTQLVQIPGTANDQTAIVKATASFVRGKQPAAKSVALFEAYGDASPKNVNSRIVTALIRMAETRAKGRALRDGINVGQTMLEELPEEDASLVHTADSASTHASASAPQAPKAKTPAATTPACPTCHGEMWDNRGRLKSAKSPLFTCKNKNCKNEKGFVTSLFANDIPHLKESTVPEYQYNDE